MTSSLLLKRSMKMLRLSGVALSNMISEYREDGKATAPETVSRWLNGTSPVEPAVLGWLAELLRAKALSMPSSRMAWPAKQFISIATCNLKGGVGCSTVAANLAVVASCDARLKIRHFTVLGKPRDDYFTDALKRLNIDSDVVTFDRMLAYRPRSKEIVIADIAREAAGQLITRSNNPFLKNFDPDILLVPADFGEAAEAAVTRDFIGVDGLPGLVRLLHRPRSMDIDFASTALAEGFDVSSNLFYPEFIPQSSHVSRHIPENFGGKWSCEDQHYYHIRLFQYLVKLAGGELEIGCDARSSIKDMTLPELLDQLERAEQ